MVVVVGGNVLHRVKREGEMSTRGDVRGVCPNPGNYSSHVYGISSDISSVAIVHRHHLLVIASQWNYETWNNVVADDLCDLQKSFYVV